jgi:hypothetical protein
VGYAYDAVCKECGAEFRVEDGPSRCARNLHCDRCGKSKFITFDEMDKLFGQEHDLGRADDDPEYQAKLEQLIKRCRCKGRFRFEAPPRCPRCRGTSFSRAPNSRDILYD